MRNYAANLIQAFEKNEKSWFWGERGFFLSTL